MNQAAGNRSSDLIIFGASDHAAVICDIARLRGYVVRAFVESSPAKSEFLDCPVVDEKTARRDFTQCLSIIGIGNPRHRKMFAETIQVEGGRFASLAHPEATVAGDVEIGPGTVVMASAVINPGCRIGQHVIVNTGSVVDHTCQLADFVQICPGATLGGNVEVGEAGWVGIGATVNQGIQIGEWTMIGAGAVVVKDLGSNLVCYGVPAVIQRRETHF